MMSTVNEFMGPLNELVLLECCGTVVAKAIRQNRIIFIEYDAEWGKTNYKTDVSDVQLQDLILTRLNDFYLNSIVGMKILPDNVNKMVQV